MLKLEWVEVLRRMVRKDSWEDMGISTIRKALEAIDGRRFDEAKDLIRYLVWEGKGLHDLYCDWIWGWYTYIAKKFW